jgi:hypothetical protein
MSSKARGCAKCLGSALISAAHWDRRPGCPEAGSPAYFRYRVSAREFPDRHRRADIAPRLTSPICRQAARCPVRSSSLQAQSCPAAGLAESVRNWWSRLAARFEPAASRAPAEPARSPPRTSPSAHKRNRASVLSACGKTDRAARGSALKSRRFRIYDTGSAKSDPSAASAGARSS